MRNVGGCHFHLLRQGRDLRVMAEWSDSREKEVQRMESISGIDDQWVRSLAIHAPDTVFGWRCPCLNRLNAGRDPPGPHRTLQSCMPR